VGWVMYTGMVSIIIYVRIKAREAYNVYGYWMEDSFACLIMWPFVCSQLSMQAKMVEPLVDVEEDPNARLYDTPLPSQNKEAQPVMMSQPMMQMQGFPPMSTAAYPPNMMPMQPMAHPMQYNGYA
jgi:hypothetical protein